MAKLWAKLQRGGNTFLEYMSLSNKANNMIFSKLEETAKTAPKRGMKEKMSEVATFGAYQGWDFMKYLSASMTLSYFQYHAWVKDFEEDMKDSVAEIKNSVSTKTGQTLSAELTGIDEKVQSLEASFSVQFEIIKEQLNQIEDKVKYVDKSS